MLLFLFKNSKNKTKGNFSKMFIYRRLRLAVFFVCYEIDLLTSTNSFIKRLIANFVNVNKIRVCISILQKQAF